MPSSAKLELVITVDGDKANAEVKRFNQNLQDIGKHGQQAGEHAGGALEHLTSHIAKGVAVGNLLASAFEKLLDVAKELAVESAKLAAQNQYAEAATEAVARANGIATEAVEKHVKAVQKLGFHDDEALFLIRRLIIAQIDLSKATDVARLATDAAAVSNVKRAEALEDIMQAVESGQSRRLRELGIFVNLSHDVEEAELRQQRALTETEKKQMNLNTVLREHASIMGAHARTTETAMGQLKAAGRVFEEIKETIGGAFLDDFSKLAGLLRTTAGYVKVFVAGWAALRKIQDDNLKSLFGIHQEEKKRAETEVESQAVRKRGKETDLQQLRKILDAEKQAHEFLLNAQVRELTGLGKILEERKKQLELHGVSKKAIQDIDAATVLLIQHELKEMQTRARAGLLEFEKRAAEQRREELRRRLLEATKFQAESASIFLETTDKQLEFEKEVAAQIRDQRLRELELIGAQTLQQKLVIEQRKLAIEIDFLNQQAVLEAEAIHRRQQREIEYLEWLKKFRPDIAELIDERIDAVNRQFAEDARQAEARWLAQIQAAREQAAVQSANIVRDHYRQIFDSLKHSAEGVFDALLTRSQSVFSAIGNAIKAAILTAIKEVVTSRVAAMLMQLLYGVRVSVSGGIGGGPVITGAAAGDGLLGRLAGVLGIGAIPAFGAALPGQIGHPASPGGTPTFSGAPIGTGSGSALSGLAGFGGLAGLKNFFGFGSQSVQIAPGHAIARSGITGNLAAIGKSDAAAFAGAGLFLHGLQRGGKLGVTETTAGGALIGFKFGGPIGAAIGASAGFFAGIVRLFIKGAREKAREKIKATYGVDIHDKNVLQQIVDIAKQGFGGNLDMAIRSQQVRDLIELYAMSTGQSIGGLPARVQPVSLAQIGGGIFQQPTFLNGGAALDRIASGVPTGAGPQPVRVDLGNVTLQLSINGESAAAALRGEVVPAVLENPRAVQAAAMDATRSSAGRREMLALQLSPGTLTS